MPVNAIKIRLPSMDQKINGEIYDKKPFKLHLKKGKTYSWCLCGKSHNQPLCDGTHKDIYLKITQRYANMSTVYECNYVVSRQRVI